MISNQDEIAWVLAARKYFSNDLLASVGEEEKKEISGSQADQEAGLTIILAASTYRLIANWPDLTNNE